jgi:hypothetical protein
MALDLLAAASHVEPDQRLESLLALARAQARAHRMDEAFATLASMLDLIGGPKEIDHEETPFFLSQTAIDVVRDEITIFASAAVRAHPESKSDVEARLRSFGLAIATQPALRFVLSWESDADVDLQVDSGGRPWSPDASVDRDALPGEGLVLADARQFGPEVYVVRGTARAYPYQAWARLRAAARPPGGAVFGHVDVIDFDGRGHVGLEEHPFVVQTVGGTVAVATVKGPIVLAGR